MNNYEKIKNMSVDEMTKFIEYSFCSKTCVYSQLPDFSPDTCDCNCTEGIKQWLLKGCEE